uniref:Uncharacterized protein n=1 Tax=Rhizophora mucronata TaxID=61149 RepID=A0A2P2P8D6_RHIMU
MLSMRFKF